MQTTEDFRTRLHSELKKKGFDIDNGRYPEGYQEAPLAYDAVWAVALGRNKLVDNQLITHHWVFIRNIIFPAFNRTITQLAKKNKRLEDFTYTNREIAEEIYNAMDETAFLGVSVRLAN